MRFLSLISVIPLESFWYNVVQVEYGMTRSKDKGQFRDDKESQSIENPIHIHEAPSLSYLSLCSSSTLLATVSQDLEGLGSFLLLSCAFEQYEHFW